MMAHVRRSSPLGTAIGAAMLSLPVALVILAGAATTAQALPEIRIHERNRVPACVTPERLQQFLEDRNRNLPERFKRIAAYYKLHGERFRVRWDYAFYQMLIETNYLTYRTGSGRWGDVKPNQNNFAGIGATGGGVPGDRYPDVSTGVLAQVQHLVAYSGEPVANPVAPRTREVQDKVVELSRALHRPVNYRDLAGRWAADRKYGNSIESIAERFRAAHCNGAPEQQIAAAPPRPAARPRSETATPPARTARTMSRGRSMPDDEVLVVNDDDAAPSAGTQPQPSAQRGYSRPFVQASAAAVPRARTCKVWTASYGGSRNVLIQTIVGEEMHLTALQVLDGQEEELAATFIETHARGGTRIDGAFANREAALVRAFNICPQAAQLQR